MRFTKILFIFLTVKIKKKVRFQYFLRIGSDFYLRILMTLEELQHFLPLVSKMDLPQR